MSIERNQASGAYRRWEPPSFGGADGPAEVALAETPAPADIAPSPPPPPPEPAVRLPTVDDIEAMFEDARRDGHAAGYREGLDQARAEAQRLRALADGLAVALGDFEHEVSGEVVALALEVARRMVRRALAEQPEAVADTVRAALAQLPQGQARIHLHPDDVALVRAHLAEQPAHGDALLVDDDAVTRGGCRVVGAASEIDATVETRWRRILEGLGRDDVAWREND